VLLAGGEGCAPSDLHLSAVDAHGSVVESSSIPAERSDRWPFAIPVATHGAPYLLLQLGYEGGAGRSGPCATSLRELAVSGS
jgi:hypothetical protein